MAWNLLAVTATIVVAAAGSLSHAAPGHQSFRWSEDFEGDDPVTLIHAYGNRIVHFAGPTTEHAPSGRHCYKLDVTFPAEGGGGLWSIPLAVPLEGTLTLRGRIRMDQAPPTPGPEPGIEAHVRLLPAGRVLGEPVFYPASDALGAWQTFEIDLIGLTRSHGAFLSIERGLWAAQREHVGFALKNLHLRVRGEQGQRVVLYLDDLVVEGRVPNAVAYDAEVVRRWAPVRGRIDAAVDQWRSKMEEAARRVDPMSGGEDARLQHWVRRAAPIVRRVTVQLDRLEQRGTISRVDHRAIEHDVRVLAHVASNLQKLAHGYRNPIEGTSCFLVPPVSGIMILPDTDPVPGGLIEAIQLTAAPGEYAPASFVLRPQRKLDRVLVTSSALRQGERMIPARRVDMKWVKCWYQSEGAWTGYKRAGPGKVLVPELLLNDPTLVRVDATTRDNHLKLRFSGGDEYQWIDDPSPVYEGVGDRAAYFARSNKDFPVRDSDHLEPIDLAAGMNQQVWCTLHVPPDAEPGYYEGFVRITSNGSTRGRIPLRVHVLPFQLATPRTFYDPQKPFTSSIYLEAHLAPRGVQTIGSYALNEVQYRATMENLVAHGVTEPTFYQNQKLDMVISNHYPSTLPAGVSERPRADDERLRESLFRRAMAIRRAAGMTSEAVYFVGINTGNPTASEEVDKLRRRVADCVRIFRSMGVTDVHIYGIDEAHGQRLRSQRPAWEAVHAVGARIFVAGGSENFEAMGDLLDVMVWSGVPKRDEAARWHSVGHRVFNYANPQVGVENPEHYRRNFGFVLWRANYDGAMTWAYQSSYMQGIWNDFNCNRRACAFAMPTVDRPIDTIAWEGYREAIDDIRYGSTLLLAIQNARLQGRARGIEIADEAEAYLESFDPDADLGEVRRRIVEYILALRGA